MRFRAQRARSIWPSITVHGIFSALLAAALTIPLPVLATQIVVLEFDPTITATENTGTQVKLIDSTTVARLQALEPTKTKAEIAQTIKNGIKSRLESIYSGLDISFVITEQLAGAPAKFNKLINIPSGLIDGDDRSLGFTRGLGNNLGWLLADEYEKENIFIPPPPADGFIRKLEMNNPDTAPINEVVNALSKTAAHELGHMYGLDDMNNEKAGSRFLLPDAGSSVQLGATDRATIDPDFGVMAQGIAILDIDFTAKQKKFLGLGIGTTGATGKAAKKIDIFSIGDVDNHGTNEDEKQLDYADFDPLITVVNESTDPTGTDALLSSGAHVYDFGVLSLDQIQDAFLQIGLFNVTAGAIVGARLETAGQSFDLLSEFLELTIADLATSVLIDLSEHLSVSELLNLGSPVSFVLDIAEPAAGSLSVDYARLVTFSAVPEPATLALLGLGIAGVSYRRGRKDKAG